MKWYRIKTILIALFLAIDIFLVFWNLSINTEEKEVSQEVIDNTVELLSKRDIKVSPLLIEKEIPKMRGIVVENSLADEAEFVGNVLGKGYFKEENRFFLGDKELIISGNRFIIREKKNIFSAEEALNWLTECKMDLSETKQIHYKGQYEFRTTFLGLELFGSSIKVRNEGEYAIAEGSLFYVKRQNESKEKIKHITSVLPLLVSSDVGKCEITGITAGYMCSSMGDNRFTEASAMPVYRISLSDGRQLFYDARK